jgi:hypothetical protein
MVLRAGILTSSHGPPIVAGSAAEMVLADEARTVSDDLADITGLTVPVVSTLAPRSGNMFISVSICAGWWGTPRPAGALRRGRLPGPPQGPLRGQPQPAQLMSCLVSRTSGQ